MGVIRIKRGLQEGVDKLSLAEGEFAVALDTGNLYIGASSGKVHVNPPGGTADVAVKLQNPREFTVSGDGTAKPVAFDGTGNVNLVLALATMSGLTPGTYTKVTVDAKGRVTAGASLEVTDLPGIPASKVTGLGSAAAKNVGTSAGNVPEIGGDGKLSTSIIPSLAIMDIFEAENEEEMLAQKAQKGDICIRADVNKSFILAAEPATTLTNWKELKTPTDAVLSVNGKTGAVTLSAADVGAEAALKNATAKAAPVDADAVPLLDSAAGNATKKVTWTALKVALKTYFDTLYNKYVHPTFTPAASGLYKVTVNAEGHITATQAVNKADITNLGIPGQDTTYGAATASKLGLVKAGSGLNVAADGTLSVGDVDGGTF